MSKSDRDEKSKPDDIPVSSLVLGSVGQFIRQLKNRNCNDAFITATTTPPVSDVFAQPGSYTILLSAQPSIWTIIYCAQSVLKDGVELTSLDFQARPQEVRELVESMLERIEEQLEDAELIVQRGMWRRED